MILCPCFNDTSVQRFMAVMSISSILSFGYLFKQKCFLWFSAIDTSKNNKKSKKKHKKRSVEIDKSETETPADLSKTVEGHSAKKKKKKHKTKLHWNHIACLCMHVF